MEVGIHGTLLAKVTTLNFCAPWHILLFVVIPLSLGKHMSDSNYDHGKKPAICSQYMSHYIKKSNCPDGMRDPIRKKSRRETTETSQRMKNIPVS